MKNLVCRLAIGCLFMAGLALLPGCEFLDYDSSPRVGQLALTCGDACGLNQQGGSITVFTTRNRRVVKEIGLGRGTQPVEVILSPDASLAYVTCSGSDEIMEIDTGDWTVSRTLDGPSKAGKLVWSPLRRALSVPR